MTSDADLRPAVLGKSRHPEFIQLVRQVVHLVLDQCTPVGIGTIQTVGRIKRDQVGRNAAEPLFHLLLLPRLLPATSADGHFLRLTNDGAHAFHKACRCPQKLQIGIYQVRVLRVVKRPLIRQELRIYPLSNVDGWLKSI